MDDIIFVTVLLSPLSEYRTKEVLSLFRKYNDSTLARWRNRGVTISAIINKGLIASIAGELVRAGVNFRVHHA